jgi:hypothetical protein
VSADGVTVNCCSSGITAETGAEKTELSGTERNSSLQSERRWCVDAASKELEGKRRTVICFSNSDANPEKVLENGSKSVAADSGFVSLSYA